MTFGVELPLDNDMSSAGQAHADEQSRPFGVPDIEPMLSRAARAERLGFDALWIRDVPVHDPEFGDAGQVYDPFPLLGFLASSTSRIMLGTAAIVVPLRHPIHTAKLAATVHKLSDERFIFGIASGDRRCRRLCCETMAIRAVAAELLEESERWFEIEEISPERRSTTLSLDLRYVGQNYELSVEASPERIREIGADSLVDRLSDDFHAIHEANYGHNDPAAAIEVVNFRCVARGGLHRLGEAEARELRTDRPTPRETRSVWFSRSGAVETPIYDRADLAPGHVVKGPAVIEQMDTTTLVHPGTVATMDSGMNLLLELAR